MFTCKGIIMWTKIWLLLVLGIAIAFSFLLFREPTTDDGESSGERVSHSLRFAEAKSVWWNAPLILADTRGIYDRYDLDLTLFDVSTGLASKNAVVQGNADIGMVASTPLVASALAGEDIVILGSYVFSADLLSIVSHEEDAESWWAESVGYVPGTISEFYMISLLRDEDRESVYTSGEMNLVKLTPPGMQPAFLRGDIRSAVIWEPFTSLIEKAAKDAEMPVVVRSISDIYALRLYLITDRETWETKREAVLDLTRVVSESSESIEREKEAARVEIESYFDYEPGFLSEKFDRTDFSFTVDREAIRATLEREAELARAAGIVEAFPDFSEMLSVLPEVREALR